MEQLIAIMVVGVMVLIIVSCFSLTNLHIFIVFGLIALVVFKMLINQTNSTTKTTSLISGGVINQELPIMLMEVS